MYVRMYYVNWCELGCMQGVVVEILLCVLFVWEINGGFDEVWMLVVQVEILFED